MKLMVLASPPDTRASSQYTQSLNVLMKDAWSRVRHIVDTVAQRDGWTPFHHALSGVIAETNAQRTTETLSQLSDRVDDLMRVFSVGTTLEYYMSLLEDETHQNNAMADPVHRQIQAMELLCIDRPDSVVIQPVFTLTLNRIAKSAWAKVNGSIKALASKSDVDTFTPLLRALDSIQTHETIETVRSFKQRRDNIALVLTYIPTLLQLQRSAPTETEVTDSTSNVRPEEASPTTETVQSSHAPIQIRLGQNLIPLAESIAEHVPRIRLNIGTQLGFFFPPVHLVDDLSMASDSVAFLINGDEMSRFNVYPEHRLALPPSSPHMAIDGQAVKEPTYGIDALWIKALDAVRAQDLGYTIIDPLVVITTHLSELIKRNVATLFTGDDTEAILKQIEDNPPSRVGDVRAHVDRETVTRVFQLLLEEGIPIGTSINIINAIALFHANGAKAEDLVERVRQANARLITRLYVDLDGSLSTMTMSEDSISMYSEYKYDGDIAPPTEIAEHIERLREASEAYINQRHLPIVLVPKHIRRVVKGLTRLHIPDLVVVSEAEILKDTTINVLAMI